MEKIKKTLLDLLIGDIQVIFAFLFFTWGTLCPSNPMQTDAVLAVKFYSVLFGVLAVSELIILAAAVFMKRGITSISMFILYSYIRLFLEPHQNAGTADIRALLCFGAVAGLLHIFEFFYLKRQRWGKEADGGLPPRNFPLIAVLADLYAFCNIWFWLG